DRPPVPALDDQLEVALASRTGLSVPVLVALKLFLEICRICRELLGRLRLDVFERRRVGRPVGNKLAERALTVRPRGELDELLRVLRVRRSLRDHPVVELELALVPLDIERHALLLKVADPTVENVPDRDHLVGEELLPLRALLPPRGHGGADLVEALEGAV